MLKAATAIGGCMKAIWFPSARLAASPGQPRRLAVQGRRHRLQGPGFRGDRRAHHSATDALYALYPHRGVTFLGWDRIARRTAITHNG
jgi:hypothetical protein